MTHRIPEKPIRPPLLLHLFYSAILISLQQRQCHFSVPFPFSATLSSAYSMPRIGEEKSVRKYMPRPDTSTSQQGHVSFPGDFWDQEQFSCIRSAVLSGILPFHTSSSRENRSNTLRCSSLIFEITSVFSVTTK